MQKRGRGRELDRAEARSEERKEKREECLKRYKTIHFSLFTLHFSPGLMEGGDKFDLSGTNRTAGIYSDGLPGAGEGDSVRKH